MECCDAQNFKLVPNPIFFGVLVFYLIGLGLKPSHLTAEAKQAMESCSKVFFESYTSGFAEGSLEGLEKVLGKKFVKLERSGVEQGFELLLKEAKEKDIALLVFGNPLNATTHVQLLLDAKELGVKARAVAGLSVFDFLGETGLDSYRFGRVCTVVKPKENYAPESFYEIIEKNCRAGLHSLCLLDISEHGEMMPVAEALQLLEKIEKKRGGNVLQESVLVGLYGLGGSHAMLKAGSLNELKRSSYDAFPQSLVVAGKLNEKEQEALRELCGWNG